MKLKIEPKPLNDLAKQTIEKSKLDHGLTWDLYEDFERVLELHLLGEEVTCPSDCDECAKLLDLPFVVSGIEFRRLTGGALLWLQEVAADAFPEGSVIGQYAIGFAMAHSYDQEVFYELCTKKLAVKAVKKWMRKNPLSMDHLALVFQALLSSSSGGDEPKGLNMIPFYDGIISQYGKSLNYWKWHVPHEVATMLVDAMFIRKAREQGIKDTENPYSQYMTADRAMWKREQQIIAEKCDAG